MYHYYNANINNYYCLFNSLLLPLSSRAPNAGVREFVYLSVCLLCVIIRNYMHICIYTYMCVYIYIYIYIHHSYSIDYILIYIYIYIYIICLLYIIYNHM